ncbi:hypothetical protein [Vibrio parahaemolyticus]|uniref:hypothetical protein n=3 Tax=Vibrio parahaemolyticus TaxID=670 RepID=UPI0022B2C627|nr:hypothetical protein [Vibrio parahaemolyticus]MCZ5860813.1 hypothetical protein [Vibrio parahaemolyticus]MCZ6279538.1 hypothetical protein [Vibrio parahaemolyticus]MDF5242435.1 hypothetical protein [Vibrio parahaemolyticus]MDF5495871.1 hypothetical protein [Vibrio parahaemolyticus]MDG2722262.1 hypothetical protein [Vibrio parahaemolyticus]
MSFGGEGDLRKVGLCGIHPLTRRYVSMEERVISNILEEILTPVSRTVNKVIGFLVVDVFVEFGCYFLGKVTLLLLTLGRFPDKTKSQEHKGKISLFGLTIFFSILIFIAHNNRVGA